MILSPHNSNALLHDSSRVSPESFGRSAHVRCSSRIVCTPKGLDEIAQGRDRRERTLGHIGPTDSTLKGLYTRALSVEPLQGSIPDSTSTQGRLPLVANPGRSAVTPSGSRDPNRRRGTTLIEMGAALALLGTVLALLVPVLSRTAGLRESVDRREVALNTVANLLERASLVTQPTPETLQPIADQLATESEIAAPQWKIVVTPEQSPPLNRVEVSLSWQGFHEVRSSVSLVRWYRGGTP